MTQHTPGPWYYKKTAIVGFIVRSATAKNDQGRDKFIADCGKVHHEPFDAEFEANAAIISAAPELLDACKAARNWFNRNTKKDHTPGPVEKMLIDAIAKAEAQS